MLASVADSICSFVGFGVLLQCERDGMMEAIYSFVCMPFGL